MCDDRLGFRYCRKQIKPSSPDDGYIEFQNRLSRPGGIVRT
jgi:hypothetical protein